MIVIFLRVTSYVCVDMTYFDSTLLYGFSYLLTYTHMLMSVYFLCSPWLSRSIVPVWIHSLHFGSRQ